jgi:hypothetical protein
MFVGEESDRSRGESRIVAAGSICADALSMPYMHNLFSQIHDLMIT